MMILSQFRTITINFAEQCQKYIVCRPPSFDQHISLPLITLSRLFIKEACHCCQTAFAKVQSPLLLLILWTFALTLCEFTFPVIIHVICLMLPKYYIICDKCDPNIYAVDSTIILMVKD